MIARGLLWAALVAGAAATLAGMLAPIHSPADFVNHFRPFICAAAGALLLGAIAARASWLTRASAVLASINVILLALPLLWSAEPAERSTAGQALASAGTRDIKIVSFNMMFGDAAAVARLLLREDADVVVLQEVGAAQADVLRALLHERYPYNRACVVARRCGAAIFAKHAWAEAGHEYWTTSTPEMIWAQFDDPGVGSFRVVGLHLHLPFRHEHQTRQIEHLIALRKSVTGPLILAGDFNMTPWAYRHQHLLAAAGLRRHATFLRSWPTDVHPQYGLPLPAFLIDHIVTTPDIKSIAVRIGPKTGSDHLPVIAELRLP